LSLVTERSTTSWRAKSALNSGLHRQPARGNEVLEHRIEFSAPTGIVKHTGPGSRLLDDPEVARLYLGVRQDAEHARA
jgi:hypothetical protein